MIRLILTLVTLLLFTPASNAISISHGEVAPAFRLTSVEGKSFPLNKYEGKVVVVLFWRTGQERSLLALQDAKAILDKYKGKGLEVLSIIEDSDNKEEALMIFKNKGIDYPLLVDRDRQVYGDYGIRVFPSTVIVDKEGKIAYDIPSHPLTYKTKLRGYVKSALGEIDEGQLKEALSPHNEHHDKADLEASRLYNLAMKFTESRMFDLAINSAVKSIDAKPDMVKSHILLGFLYLETDEPDKALETFNQALELDPGSNDARTGLGGVLITKGDVDKAIETLEPAARANPYPQMTYYELGKAYELKGDKEKSMKMYKKAIEKIIHKKILPSSISKCK
jgi:tetratricopeptide (TPR) repeat protein